MNISFRPLSSSSLLLLLLLSHGSSLLLLLLLLLSHGTYISMASSSWDDQDFFRHCPPARCSKHGPEIRFLHRLQSSNTSSACGASCARLTCSGQDTILHHPHLGPCNVTSIDYKEGVMKIIPLVGTSSPCPLQKLIFDSLTPYDSQICALYMSDHAKVVHCSKEFTPSGTSLVDGDWENIADYIVGPIPCLGDTKHFAYLVYAQLCAYVLPLDCKIISRGSIPIPRPPYYPIPFFKQRAEAITNFAETNVSWVFLLGVGDLNYCTTCELQNQRCAFSSQRNQTFCMGGHHHGNTIANCQIPTVSSDSEAIEVNMLDYLILGRYESMGTAFPPGITDLPDFEAALLMLSWFILKLQ